MVSASMPVTDHVQPDLRIAQTLTIKIYTPQLESKASLCSSTQVLMTLSLRMLKRAKLPISLNRMAPMSRDCGFTTLDMSCQTVYSQMNNSTHRTVVLRSLRVHRVVSSAVSIWHLKSLSISTVMTYTKTTITQTLENCTPLTFHHQTKRKHLFRITTSSTFQTSA